MSEDYVVPEIIDHDAFFDIHFRGADTYDNYANN